MNRVLYHDFYPEFHMNLHSPFVQNSKQGWGLLFMYTGFIIVPVLTLAYYIHTQIGYLMRPVVRNNKDNYHMGPKLLDHLRQNNYEKMPDLFGRNGPDFYKNFIKQTNDMKPGIV